MKVLIDTGIFISVLNKEKGYENSFDLLETIRQKKVDGFISVMTIAELISVYQRLGDEETTIAKMSVEGLISDDRIVPITKQLAEIAGKVKSAYRLSLGDAFIIATAMSIDCDYLISLDPEIKQVDGKLVPVREPKPM